MIDSYYVLFVGLAFQIVIQLKKRLKKTSLFSIFLKPVRNKIRALLT